MEVMSLNFGTDGFDLEATLEVMPLSLGSDTVEFGGDAVEFWT